MVVLALAVTAIVHGAETRVRHLEPDPLPLVAYAGALFDVWHA